MDSAPCLLRKLVKTACGTGTLRLNPHPGGPVELTNTRHFLLKLQHANRAHHLSNRYIGSVGPKDAAIFVFIIVVPNLRTILLPQSFSVAKFGTPREQRVTEVQ